jgi:hypothetical protein
LAYWYLYPGAKVTGIEDSLDAMELIPSITYRWFTVTYAHSVTDKSGVNGKFAPTFHTPLDPKGNSKNSWYLEGAVRIPLFVKDLFLNASYGHQAVKNYSKLNFNVFQTSVDYTLPENMHGLNLKVGMSTTNNDEKYYTVVNSRGEKKNIGRSRFFFTLTKSF